MRTAFITLPLLAVLAGCGSPEEAPVDPVQQARIAEQEQRLHSVCSAPQTYARLKELLFDEAVRQRGGDPAGLDAAITAANLSVLEPVTATGNPQGVVVCSGRVLLELPGDPEARRLAADVEYAAQAASDGSGLVFDLEGAGAMVRELALLGGPAATAGPAQPPSTEPPTGDAHRAIHSDGPSFDCSYARLPSEKMICASRPLAALDREMASLYYDRMARADERTRQLLRRTRDAFLTRRDRCQQSTCIASVYEDRIDEIRRIPEPG